LLRERFYHEFAILRHLLFQYEKKSEHCCVIMTSMGCVSVCVCPQMNKILRPTVRGCSKSYNAETLQLPYIGIGKYLGCVKIFPLEGVRGGGTGPPNVNLAPPIRLSR